MRPRGPRRRRSDSASWLSSQRAEVGHDVLDLPSRERRPVRGHQRALLGPDRARIGLEKRTHRLVEVAELNRIVVLVEAYSHDLPPRARHDRDRPVVLRDVGSRIGQGLLEEPQRPDRKSTRLNSSHGYISYAVFCLKKKKKSITSVEP